MTRFSANNRQEQRKGPIQRPEASGKNQWFWSNAQRDSGGQVCGVPRSIYVEVAAPGEHTISVSMREDGFEFD